MVPFYREALTPEEQISLRHLEVFGDRYDRVAVIPASLGLNPPGFEPCRFPDRYFTDVAAYSRLCLSAPFYERFGDYRFILLYQLDCLVFSDQLLEWCELDYDYVGAPWLRSRERPAAGFSRVGNGGFSLRKVASLLAVLRSERYRGGGSAWWRDLMFAPLPDLEPLSPVPRAFKRLRVLRSARFGVAGYVSGYTLNEDHFWSDRARLFYPQFRIAPVEVALRFSFEYGPRACYQRSGGRLPFGCHGWHKHDREFWQPFLLFGAAANGAAARHTRSA